MAHVVMAQDSGPCQEPQTEPIHERRGASVLRSSHPECWMKGRLWGGTGRFGASWLQKMAQDVAVTDRDARSRMKYHRGTSVVGVRARFPAATLRLVTPTRAPGPYTTPGSPRTWSLR